MCARFPRAHGLYLSLSRGYFRLARLLNLLARVAWPKLTLADQKLLLGLRSPVSISVHAYHNAFGKFLVPHRGSDSKSLLLTHVATVAQIDGESKRVTV